MKEARRRQMQSLIEHRGSISMEDLCKEFQVSMNTIRTDVAYLVKNGTVEKVYGGVRAKQRREVPLFDSRAMLHPDKKESIARAAADLIEEGDIIYIDAGTTTMHILDYLDPGMHITVVTPNLPVVLSAYKNPNITLVVLPGMYNRRTNALLDGSSAEYLTRYQHTKAFMGVSALAVDGGLGVSSFMEYELKRTAVARSRKVILLVDSSKYGEPGLLTYGSALDMSHVLTDDRIPIAFAELCRKGGVPIDVL